MKIHAFKWICASTGLITILKSLHEIIWPISRWDFDLFKGRSVATALNPSIMNIWFFTGSWEPAIFGTWIWIHQWTVPLQVFDRETEEINIFYSYIIIHIIGGVGVFLTRGGGQAGKNVSRTFFTEKVRRWKWRDLKFIMLNIQWVSGWTIILVQWNIG